MPGWRVHNGGTTKRPPNYCLVVEKSIKEILTSVETRGAASIIEASSTLKGDRSEWTMGEKSELCVGGKSEQGWWVLGVRWGGAVGRGLRGENGAGGRRGRNEGRRGKKRIDGKRRGKTRWRKKGEDGKRKEGERRGQMENGKGRRDGGRREMWSKGSG
ncbi:hypothetical protein Pcinc_038046 [Petrolisthes cinctipes]|uniref:Uncharacterized protein n=1 Tax=Petrolisthes cinctipes TaxID=88211 RepID=A0AAE1EKS2_PETCI|nr:hypothetical protein Pcinc_038046 [Petrolisthes cinctipes]